MKKYVFFILAVFILNHGNSQRVNYGIGAGLNYTNLALSNIPESDSEYKIGMQVTAIITFKPHEKLWLRLEPGFTQRGSVMSYSKFPDTRIILNYLVLPTVLEFSLSDKFSVLLGPEMAYCVSANAKENGNITDIKSIFDSNIDVEAIAGVSYRIINNVALEIKYNRGFVSTINDLKFFDEYGNSEGYAKLYNQGITFSLVYIFRE